MNREAQNLLLLLVGAIVVKTALDGTFLRYVKPSLQPYLVASGVTILVVATVAIATDVRRGFARVDPDGGRGREHWLLLAPALLILVAAPPALGAAASTVGTIGEPVAVTDDRVSAPLAPGVPQLTLLDVIRRAANDPNETLNGRTISTTGVVLRPHGSNKIYLSRVLIICCAADARTLRIELAGAAGSELEDGQWATVTGRVVPGSAAADTTWTPTMDVRYTRRVDPPLHTYEY